MTRPATAYIRDTVCGGYTVFGSAGILGKCHVF